MPADRNLLFGLLALQCGFISKEQLVAAMAVWTSDKQKSLEQILCDNNAISPPHRALLGALVEEHLKQHGGDAEKSLAALSSLPPIKAELEELADPDVSATLVLVKSGETKHYDAGAASSIESSPSQGGRFVFLRAHAKGGLGQVSVALDNELNRHVALKEILPQRADDPESQGRFVLEAEITGQLEHPGIVPVYGLGNYGNGRPYYAMRFVEGENLKRAIERFHQDRKPSEQLTGEKAVAFRNLLGRFVDVCNAIEYAHSRRVLHRDLKPENILLGPYGETLVVDWGLAKPIGAPVAEDETKATSRPVQLRSGTSSESYDGMVVGTPAYMSPEQAEGKINELGPATDVYSLGATLYPLLTGNPPIKGDSLMDTLEKARLNKIERPRTHWGAIPPPLEAVCLKAMALQPSDRYSSAKALAEDIEKWLADEPVSALVEPFSVRAKRWIKRHPVIVSTSAACVVLGLCAALFVAYLQGAHAKELARKNGELTIAKNNAEEQRGRAEQREQDAIDAVKRFGDAVTNNRELKNNPTLKSLRKELLKEPLGFFKTLRIRLQRDNDTRPESIVRLGGAAFALGRLTDEIGDKLDAIVAYREAKTIWERLARENPSVSKYQSDLASNYHNIGNLLCDTGKPAEGMAAYEEAKTIREQLVRENPSVIEYQSDLANSHTNLGILFSDTGKSADALAAYKRAILIRERLAREYPSATEMQSALAESHHNLGQLLRDTGKPAEALTAYEKAKVTQERLAGENGSVTEFKLSLAGLHNSIGILLGDTGKPSEALAAYERAKAIQEQLARENPSVTSFQNALARSHNNIGNLHRATGKLTEGLGAYAEAKKIWERLAKDYPAVTEYQNYLARIHHNIGSLLTDAGKPGDALTAYEQAISIQERLARENPTVTDYQNDLASNHINMGILLLGLGKPTEALAAYEKAKTIREQLARGNPTVPEFQNDLASCCNNMGNLFSGIGKPMEALTAYEQALRIRERLAKENLSVTKYQSDLASSYNNIGALLSDAGKSADAFAAYEKAKTIQEQLARESPAVTEFQSSLGATLSNLAMIHYESQQYAEARDLVREAIKHQELALAASPKHPTYRQFLRNHLAILIAAAEGLHDAKLVEEAERELLELSTSDPQFAALDERIKNVLGGEPAKDPEELLAFGQRAYDLQRYAQATRFYGEALEREPSMADDRGEQIAYNAACTAALAANSKGLDDPAPDEAARAKLREQALAWLKGELDRWGKYLESAKPQQRAEIAETLKHWQEDADLAGVREDARLAKLPEVERAEWQGLWKRVGELLAKAESPHKSSDEPAK